MIVAHPDDETLWGGADLMKESYFVVCLTNNYHTKRSKEFLQITVVFYLIILIAKMVS